MPTQPIQKPQSIFFKCHKTLLNTYITIHQRLPHNIEHLKINYTLNIINKLMFKMLMHSLVFKHGI